MRQCISVDLLRVQLQLRDDVYSLYRRKFGLWIAISGFSLKYVGSLYMTGFCSTYFTVTLAGL